MKKLVAATCLAAALSVQALIPNPASQNCIDLGGIIEITETPNGQYGECVIGEWTIFRKMIELKLITQQEENDSKVVVIAGPNPATENCLVRLEGKSRLVITDKGESRNCVIEEWSLFRKVKAPAKN